MSVLTQEEFMQAIQNVVGDSTDDNTITFIENMTDTYNDLNERANPDGVNWQQRAEEIDKEWKEKYTKRFFSSEAEPPKNEPSTPPNKPLKYEDLFKQGE